MADTVLQDIEELLDELDREVSEGATLNSQSYMNRIDRALLNCGRIRRQLNNDLWEVIMTALYSLRSEMESQRGGHRSLYHPPRIAGKET